MGILQFIANFTTIINKIIPVLILVGVLVFIWGIVKLMAGKSEEAKKDGRDYVLRGIIGLAVIVSIWGLVNFLKQSVGITGPNVIHSGDIPCVPSNGYSSPGSTNTGCY